MNIFGSKGPLSDLPRQLSDAEELGFAETVRERFANRPRTLTQLADDLDMTKLQLDEAILRVFELTTRHRDQTDALAEQAAKERAEYEAKLTEVQKIQQYYAGESHARADADSGIDRKPDADPITSGGGVAAVPEPDTDTGEAPRPAPEVQVR